MKIDLHIHSNYSFDSTLKVEDIINLAQENNIDVISIVDHNEYLGSIKALSNNKVEVISGIEIDCFFNEDIIHILGYGLDFNDKKIDDLKEHYKKELNRIAYERLKIIEDRYNCKLDLDKIKSYSNFDRFSNVEIERVLLEDVKHKDLEIYQTGIKKDNPIANFYWDNLSIGKWGYVEIKLPDYKEVIDLIHANQGVAILAHPKVNLGHNKSKIIELINSKIDGIEVYTSYHSEEDNKFFNDIVCEYDLIKTVGSDFHGSTKPNISIGQTGYNKDCTNIYKSLMERISKYRISGDYFEK